MESNISDPKELAQKLEHLKKEYENLSTQRSVLIPESGTSESRYTVILPSKSMSEFGDGVDIIINDKAKYLDYIDTLKCVVVGVVGNFDKGKSFICGKISENQIHSGYNVETEAISIMYPKDKSHGIAVFDSSGFEVPILPYKDNRVIEGSVDVPTVIREKIIDRTHRENFLQQFILENSSIVLLVVNKIECADQKLYNRLKLNTGSSDNLCVIHNLSLIHDVKEVQTYIEDTLKKCFNFEEHTYISLNRDKSQQRRKFNNTYYIDQIPTNQTGCTKKIAHFIIAREGTAAGNYFNPPAFDFFKNKICAITETKHLDPIKKFSEYLDRKRATVFKESDPPIIEYMEDPNFLGPFPVKIKLPHRGGLTELSVDELGFSSTSSQVERYRLSKNSRIFTIELAVYDIIFSSVEFCDYISESYSIFKVRGRRQPKPTGVEFISNSRDNTNEFNFDVKILAQDVETDGRGPKASYKNGVLTLVFNLNIN
jgi:hypothetical protein